MRWTLHRNRNQPTSARVLEAAWQSEIAVMKRHKVTTDPRLIPCSHCGVEVHWNAASCSACLVAYDDYESRFRARMYESLL